MEMFESYFLEEYGRKCIRNEYGFCFYKINGDECHIADFSISSEYRHTYEGKKLFSEVVNIARLNDCKFVSASVHIEPLKAEKATKLLRCYLAMGFKTFSANNNHVVLAYELKEN